MATQRGNDIELGQGPSGSLTFPRDARDKHLYICGGTGTGKSKLLEWLIRQDIVAWRDSHCGMLVLDPHGSLYDGLMRWLAQHDPNRPIIPIDLRRDDWVVSYNVLRKRSASAAVIVDNLVDAMAHVWGQSGTDHTPLFARWASNTIGALYDHGHTLAEAIHLTDRTKVRLRRSMTENLTDPVAGLDWKYANSLSPRDFDKEIGSTISRLGRFVRHPFVRSMLGQTEVSLDLGTALDQGHIILVCLARERARISSENADTFATLLLSDLWMAAQERGKRHGLNPFYVYIDEFQRFVTPTIAENLDEARGFGLHLTMAHQFPKRLLSQGESGQRVYDSIMENATTKAVFRLSHKDNLEPMAEWLFRGTVDPDEIKHVLYSTKVVGYRREFLRAYAEGETATEGTSTYEGNSFSDSGQISMSRSGTFDDYGPFEPTTETQGQSSGHTTGSSSGSTESHSRSTSRTSGMHETLVPILGKEISSIERRSVDEQFLRAMAVLFDQKERHFLVRMADRMQAPMPLRTPTVREGTATDERLERYTQRQRLSWPFFLPVAEATLRLKAREDKLLDTLKTPGTGEPVAYRRKIDK